MAPRTAAPAAVANPSGKQWSSPPAMTLDPVSTGDPGWEAFLDAYNEWSIQHSGIPLFNQSPRLTPAQAKQALGPQIKEFQDIRRRYDPTDRLYTDWFRGLFE